VVYKNFNLKNYMNLRTKLRKIYHIRQRIAVSEKKMWDLEFLKNKMRAQREGFRQEYDRINELVDAATRRLDEEKQKKDKDQTIIDNLTKYKEKHQPDIEQLKMQIEGIDGQIEGADGKQGMDDVIDGYKTIIDLLKEWKKQVWSS